MIGMRQDRLMQLIVHHFKVHDSQTHVGLIIDGIFL